VIRPATAAVRAALILAALVTLVARGPAARQAALVPAGTPAAAGPVVRLAYRSLQPGEPVLVFLDNDGTVRSASASLLGKTAEMRAAPSPRTVPNPRSGDLFAFLGIDVQAKTGPCVMTVKLRRAGGTVESVRQDLEIVERKFPSTKLQFKPEYVTPPASLQARIKRESELLALATSVVTPEWLGAGPFALPHDAPSWANFGQRRLNNNVLQSLHTGLDIRVPFGEPIRASNAGTVVMASDLYFGGKTVIIDHGLGVFSSYGHMSGLLVKRGEAVRRGQTVGLCGTTGRSTGPHLHWSFKVLETRVDPEAMLRLPL
jgi:hypothetical protein